MTADRAFEGDAARSKHARRIAAAIIAVFVVFGAATRFVGIDALLPQILLRDGLAVVLQTEWLRSGQWPETYEQRWGAYPHLLSRIVSLLPATTAPPGATLQQHLACAIEPWVQARCVNVLASLALVPATYALARRFLDRARSLLAAGFIAMSLGITTHALQERPHPLLTLATLLATLAALRLRRRTSFGAHFGAAAAAAASVGALHSGVLALIPIAWARIAHAERKPIGRFAGFTIVGGAALLAVWLFYPFLLTQKPDVVPNSAVSMGGQNLHFARFRGGGFERLVDWMWWFEPFLTLLATAGLARLAWYAARAPMTTIRALGGGLGVVLAFVLPYFGVFALYDESAGRYIMPIVPFFAVAAASIAPRSWWCLALVLPSALCAVRMSVVRARPDTIEEATALVERMIPSNERVATIPDFDLPLATDPRAVAENFHPETRSIWSRYQASLRDGSLPEPRYDVILNPLRLREPPQVVTADPFGVVQRSGARWVLIDCAIAAPQQMNCRSALRDKARFVQRFSHRQAGDDADESLLDPGETRPFRVLPLPLRIWSVRALGPTLEVYALP